MKKSLFVILFFISVTAFAHDRPRCMNECSIDGNTYEFCNKICGYGE